MIDAVDDSNTSLDAAVGVARLLLANKGDTSVLKGNQKYVYEKCLEPIFHVSCEGVFGEGDCPSGGEVDAESLLLSYQEDEFLCQHCRYDGEKIAAE